MTYRLGGSVLALSFLSLSSLSSATTAEAQDEESAAVETTDLLNRAESAYQAVDYETALALAQQALGEGTADRAHVVRIYELIGIAAAALHREDVSRNAFIRLLALNPDARVNQRLAPPLRGPFVEALGFWSSRGDSFGVEATLLRRREELRVTITDPLNMAATAVVGSRRNEVGAFDVRRNDVEQSSALYVPIEGARDAQVLEYYVRVQDRSGNQLLEIGTEDEPEVVVAASRVDPVAATLVPSAEEAAHTEEGDTIFTSPIFWIVVGALIVGAGVTVGVVLSDSTAGARATISFGVR